MATPMSTLSPDSANNGAGNDDGRPQRPANRARSSSFKETLQYIAHPPKDHPLMQMHQATDQVPTPTQTPTLSREPSDNDKSFPTSSAKGDQAPSQKKAEAVTAQGKHKKKDKYADLKVEVFESRGIWNDIYTMRWMRIPESSLKIIAAFVLLWLILELTLPNTYANPLAHFLFISYPLPLSAALERGSTTDVASNRLSHLFSAQRVIRQVPKLTNFFATGSLTSTPPHPTRIAATLQGQLPTHYAKGALDLCFLFFYVIVFAFVRQALTEWFIKPLAIRWGIKGESSLRRFMEQGYAFCYFSVFGILGLFVMSQHPSWWYNCTELWVGYPHWRMDPYTKVYYLLQFSYWLQQMLVLVLRIEKPRSDFFELVIHHYVTLWLVGWSYSIHLTIIGVTIFVSMDFGDIFLAFAKCLNYLKLQRPSEIAFGVFLCVWLYFRHYLNILILYSVWTEFDKIPEWARHFRPWEDLWLAQWMKWQIFIPIFLLQLLNAFWTMLIFRILFRILAGGGATDVREEGEEDEDAEIEETKKTQ